MVASGGLGNGDFLGRRHAGDDDSGAQGCSHVALRTAHAPGGAVHQDRFTRLQPRPADQREVRGQIVQG